MISLWACWCQCLICHVHVVCCISVLIYVQNAEHFVAVLSWHILLVCFCADSEYLLFFYSCFQLSFHSLLFCVCDELLISDNSCISNVHSMSPAQRHPSRGSSVREESEVINYQPQHSEDICTPVITPPVNRCHNCSSFFCCQDWSGSSPEKVCSICKKPIGKYVIGVLIRIDSVGLLLLECVLCVLVWWSSFVCAMAWVTECNLFAIICV